MNELSYKSFMAMIIATWNNLVQKPHHVASFVAVWYYIELLYMMNIAIYFYPPVLISTVGVVLGIVISIHILKLYIGNAINCTIQLIVMDIHIAYSFGLTIANIVSGTTWYGLLIVLIRDIIASIELLLVFAMAKDE